MRWIEWYLVAGVAVLMWLVIFDDSEELPRGWWGRLEFAAASLFVVAFWWLIVWLILVNRVRRSR